MTRLLLLLPLLSLCAAGCSSSPYAPTNITNNTSTVTNSAVQTAVANATLRGTNAASSAIQSSAGTPAVRVFRSAAASTNNTINSGAAFQAAQANAIANRYSNQHFAQLNPGYASSSATVSNTAILTTGNTDYTNGTKTYVYVTAGPGMLAAAPVASLNPHGRGFFYGRRWNLAWLIPQTGDAHKVAGWFTDSNGNVDWNGTPGPHLIDPPSMLQTATAGPGGLVVPGNAGASGTTAAATPTPTNPAP